MSKAKEEYYNNLEKYNLRKNTYSYNYIKELEQQLNSIQSLVNEQAEDEGLWFDAETASEKYLQIALRKLHGVIENE